MKRLTICAISAAFALAAGAAFEPPAGNASAARPRKVVLIVQNHCTGDVNPPVNALADTLASELSGAAFSIVKPDDSIGAGQNRGPGGEAMPPASALELGRLLGADGAITASIQEFRAPAIGAPPVAYHVKSKITISLADCATGGIVCSAVKSCTGPNFTSERMKEDNAAIFEEALHSAVTECVKEFLRKYEKTAWAARGDGRLTVGIVCNINGADMEIDGLSHGTCPAKIRLSRGIHKIRVSYPHYCIPVEKTLAVETEGQTFMFDLPLTEAGEAQRAKYLEYEQALQKLDLERRKAERAFEEEKRAADFDFDTRKKNGELEIEKKRAEWKLALELRKKEAELDYRKKKEELEAARKELAAFFSKVEQRLEKARQQSKPAQPPSQPPAQPAVEKD